MKTKLYLLFWMCCSVLFAACEGDDSVPAPLANRTVLIYLAADNTLSKFVSIDLEEMKQGMKQLNDANSHLLVYIDTGSSPRLIELKVKNGVVTEEMIKSYESRNSVGAAETIEVFKDVFSNENYLANSYGLVYWSHGDGWVPNPLPTSRWIGQDGDNFMNIADLVTILDQAPHFDFVLFDACFMQSIEVAYELRSFTDYYIGSPTEIPGPGARYDVLVPALFSQEEVALKVAEAYYAPYDEIYENGKNISNSNWTGGVSVCALKSAELESLANITNQVLAGSAGSANLRSTVYDYDKRFSGHMGYYDLVEMMHSLTDESNFAIWKQAYNDAVLYWKTTPMNYSSAGGGHMFSMKGTNGVSHYIPFSTSSAVSAAYRSTEWYKDAGLSKLGW